MELGDKLKKDVDAAQKVYAANVNKYKKLQVSRDELQESLSKLKACRFLLREFKAVRDRAYSEQQNEKTKRKEAESKEAS